MLNHYLTMLIEKGMQGTREYMLNKNYRSKSSELMTFSSKEFYNGELDVINSHSSNNVSAIQVFDVNGKWEHQSNEKEATSMLNVLLHEKDRYHSVILLTLNAKQKSFVEQLIYSETQYAPILEMLEQDRVVLRNLENIQGDEADLVIVSVAYDKNASLGATYVAKPTGKNALNVAISRAKEKMIVLKSIRADEVNVKPGNESMQIFKNWLAFLETSREQRMQYSIGGMINNESFDSGFEVDVYEYIRENLKTKGKYSLMTQYPVGSYRIDQAFIGEKGEFILGLEIDGYAYHSGFEKISKDIERQRFLEAKGYPIYRITELAWRTNKKRVIKQIQQLLNK